MAPTIIDDEVKLSVLLDRCKECKSKEQLVFVDLEGINLCRQGTVAIMQLLMPPEPIVYLVDIHMLGSKAFDFTTDDGTSLKSILESGSIFKVFFDVRNDSDALYAHFGINMAGVIDLQVIEFVTRPRMGRYLNGLARCIENDLPYTPGWSLTKANGRRLFEPELGGRYEVFLERPIPTHIAKYCENDVLLMPRLLTRYGPKLRPNIAAQVQTIVDDRISSAKSPTYNGKGRHMAIGPSLYLASEYKDSQISPGMALVCSSRLSELCRVDDSLLDDLFSKFNNVQIVQKPSTKSGDVPSDSKSTAADSAVNAANASA